MGGQRGLGDTDGGGDSVMVNLDGSEKGTNRSDLETHLCPKMVSKCQETNSPGSHF